MKYRIKPTVPHESELIFSWDSETGELSGKDADRVRKMASMGGVEIHPLPSAWEFSSEPLKSKTDMAAILGRAWQLPDDLRSHYPGVSDRTPKLAVK